MNPSIFLATLALACSDQATAHQDKGRDNQFKEIKRLGERLMEIKNQFLDKHCNKNISCDVKGTTAIVILTKTTESHICIQ